MKITGLQPDCAGFSHAGQSISLVDGIAEVDVETGIALIQAGLAAEWVEPEPLPEPEGGSPTGDTATELAQADEAAEAATTSRKRRR